jgi:hypothetical protein
VENLVARLTLTLITILTYPNTRSRFCAPHDTTNASRQRGDLSPRSHSGAVCSLRSPAHVFCVLLVGLCLVPMTADGQVGQDRVLRQLPPNIWMGVEPIV